MPCDYSKYPANWKTEIRPDILKRADNKCEQCGVKNYSTGYWDKEGNFYTDEYIIDSLEDYGYDIFADGNPLAHVSMEKKPVKVVLTIAHLDHDLNNNDYSNLKALCQLHHNRHDIAHRKKTRFLKKNPSLF